MKQHNVAYWSWAWGFHRFTGLCIVLQTILNLNLAVRKELLGLCRTQSLPTPGSLLRDSMAYLHTYILIPTEPTRHLDSTTFVSSTILDLIDMYSDVFTDHLTAAIVAHALRIAPGIDADDYRQMLLATVAKELTAAITVFNHVPLDYRSIFSADARHRSVPLCSRLPPSEEVASDTYIQFCDLKSRLSNRILFPRGGSKTVGQKVARNFWESYYQNGCTFKHEEGKEQTIEQVTVDDCLRMYQETGGYPEGPVEVRTSWKYSQITPRVYYARGGTVQVAAQYIQEIVNIVIDAFPEVHRIDRFSPPSDPLADDDVEIIYDYASFTSTLDAVIPFVDSLSRFFQGVTVRIIDPIDGLVATDLGDLFAEYNRVCNSYQQFDISRLSLTEDCDTILQHTCGMLGVEGNIFLATLLHGIFLRFLSGLHRSKCVGDDARAHHKTSDGQFSLSDREYLYWTLSSIGDLSFDKIAAFEAYSAREQVYRYIKRPFFRSENIMMTGLLLALPSQIPLTGALDSFHTVIPTKAHPCRNVFKQIVRFIDTLAIHSVRIDYSEIGSHPITIHLAYLTRLMRQKDPDGVYSDFGRSNKKTHYRLPPYDLWGRVKYSEWFVGTIGYSEMLRLPKYGGAEENGSCDGRVGSIMIRRQSKARSFLVRMGFLDSEMLYDEYSIEMLGLTEIVELLEGQYTSIMKYSVLKDVPVWYTQIPEAL